jgi:hypothetical protein
MQAGKGNRVLRNNLGATIVWWEAPELPALDAGNLDHMRQLSALIMRTIPRASIVIVGEHNTLTLD